MSLAYCTLLSGSGGNSAYIESGTDAVLLDAGASGRELFRLLEVQKLDPARLRAVLVTHEHSDHARGVGVVARRLKLPVYATAGTWRGMERAVGPLPDHLVRVVRTGEAFSVGTLTVTPVPLSHDTLEPCGYVVEAGGSRVAFVTDTGVLTEVAFRLASLADGLVIEANHDTGMLKNGPYPFFLKKRILGDTGHMSNEYCGTILKELVGEKTRHVLLAHLSRENNLPDLALAEIRRCLAGHRLTVSVAPRSHPHPLIRLDGQKEEL